jgi:Ca2+-binding RTX toxin-like protein
MTTRTFRGLTYTIESILGGGKKLKRGNTNDWLEVTGSNNQINTSAGNDVILAGAAFLSTGDYPPYGGEAVFFKPLADAGDQRVFSGAGNDYVVTGSGNDYVDLGEGDDIYDGSFFSVPGGNDTIKGGAGKDTIYAWGGGNKTIWGGTGNDVIDIRDSPDFSGHHFIDGGAGNDRINVTNDTSAVLVNAGSGDNIIDLGATQLIATAGDGADSIVAFVKTGMVASGGGNDQIFLLAAEAGAQIWAGAGDDWIAIGLNALSGFGTADGGAGNDTLLTPNFFGEMGSNILRGGAGNDIMLSGLGNDVIHDGRGHDVINLRGGNVDVTGYLVDSIVGGSPLVVAGGGNDTVYLEQGNDTVILGSGGFASIRGFSHHDRLDVTGLNASFTRSGSDTLISSGGSAIGILQGYTGTIGLV